MPLEIAVVGAGFSGTMTAAHLLRQTAFPLGIHLIEGAAGQFARGVAYGTALDCHLLNVPAGNMSAFADDPEHFLRWAQERETTLPRSPWMPKIASDAFLPRRVYGDYLSDVLDDAERTAQSRLHRRLDKALMARVTPEGVTLRLLSGEEIRAHKLVLALGNFPPGDPRLADPAFYEDPRYHRNPWAPDLLQDLLETDSCLLIGSGLTMVDWVVALGQSGYQGKIHTVSRRGLWPQAHRLVPPAPFNLDPDGTLPSVRIWLRTIRRHIARSGCDWRTAIDALRPHSQMLWQRLSVAERRRFLRHLRPYWDCHRHRLAPEIAQQLQSLLDCGQLIRHVGRILEYRRDARRIEALILQRGTGGKRTIQIGAVVNCSGSESDYRNLESPLVRDLLDQGLARPDPQSLGLDVAANGALISSNGAASDRLFTLGPPEKGILWETTAVPEIRGQAERLARNLLQRRS